MDESIATVDQIAIIEGIDQIVWQKMSNALRSDGYVSEFNRNIPLPMKETIRSTKFEILKKLRENGYEDKTFIYIENNIGGTNGYAFYNPDVNPDAQEMTKRLTDEINKTLQIFK